MFGAERFFTDGEGAAVERFGVAVAALLAVELRQRVTRPALTIPGAHIAPWDQAFLMYGNTSSRMESGGVPGCMNHRPRLHPASCSRVGRHSPPWKRYSRTSGMPGPKERC